MGSLRFVVVYCPYDSWEQGNTKEMFSKILSLKLAGYNARSSSGKIPVDSTDLVAAHLLICEDSSDGALVPVACCKSVSFARCQTHNLRFPVSSEIVAECDRQGRELAFQSEWTIAPEVRKDPQKVSRIEDMLPGASVLFSQQLKTDDVLDVTGRRVKTADYSQTILNEANRWRFAWNARVEVGFFNESVTARARHRFSSAA